jgi:hypothetical protein
MRRFNRHVMALGVTGDVDDLETLQWPDQGKADSSGQVQDVNPSTLHDHWNMQ